MRRKVKLSRILILILIPILIVSGSVYVIYMLFTQEESVIEEKSYYDLNLFSLENGLMTYKDSLYKVSTGIDVSSHNGAVFSISTSQLVAICATHPFSYSIKASS
jgi:lysozyme